MSEFTYHAPAARMTFFKQMVIFSAIGSLLVIASQIMVIVFVKTQFASVFLSSPAFGDFIMLEALSYGAILVYFVGFIGVVISSLMLIHRLTANINAMGFPIENSPAWGVGWWFVPVANLFKPYQHLKDLLDKSAHGGTNVARLGRVMLFWWLGWVLYNIGASITERLIDEPNTVDEIVNAGILTVGQELFGLAVLFGYFFVLRSLSEIQAKRSQLIDVF